MLIKLIIAMFVATGIAKLTTLNKEWIAFQINNNSNNQLIVDLLNYMYIYFQKLHIFDIKAFELINMGKGFEDFSLFSNFIITYTLPIFLILLVIGLFKRKKPVFKLSEEIKSYIEHRVQVEVKNALKKR